MGVKLGLTLREEQRLRVYRLMGPSSVTSTCNLLILIYPWHVSAPRPSSEGYITINTKRTASQYCLLECCEMCISLIHGAELFLKSHQLCSHSRISQDTNHCDSCPLSTLLVEGWCLTRHSVVPSLLANDLLACCGPVLCHCCVYLYRFNSYNCFILYIVLDLTNWDIYK
jgi:hypothetical protein